MESIYEQYAGKKKEIIPPETPPVHPPVQPEIQPGPGKEEPYHPIPEKPDEPEPKTYPGKEPDTAGDQFLKREV